MKADFVGLAVSLPLSRAEFDGAKQAGFKRAIASSAGVNVSNVEIVSFAQSSTRRSESRKLLVRVCMLFTYIHTYMNTYCIYIYSIYPYIYSLQPIHNK